MMQRLLQGLRVGTGLVLILVPRASGSGATHEQQPFLATVGVPTGPSTKDPFYQNWPTQTPQTCLFQPDGSVVSMLDHLREIAGSIPAMPQTLPICVYP